MKPTNPPKWVEKCHHQENSHFEVAARKNVRHKKDRAPKKARKMSRQEQIHNEEKVHKKARRMSRQEQTHDEDTANAMLQKCAGQEFVPAAIGQISGRVYSTLCDDLAVSEEVFGWLVVQSLIRDPVQDLSLELPFDDPDALNGLMIPTDNLSDVFLQDDVEIGRGI